MAWKSFDSRFDEILQQIAFQRTILSEILNLDQANTNFEARKKIDTLAEAAKQANILAEKARNAQHSDAKKAEIERQAQEQERKKAEEQRKTELARLEQVTLRYEQERQRRHVEQGKAEERKRQDMSRIGNDLNNMLQVQRGTSWMMIAPSG